MTVTVRGLLNRGDRSKRSRIFVRLMICGVLGTAASLLFSPPAQAASCDVGTVDVTWDGGAATFNWNDAANWNPNVVPSDADDVCIPSSTPGTPTIVYSVTPGTGPEINSLEAQEALTLTGGTLSIAAASEVDSPNLFWLDGGTLNGAGTLTLNGPNTWTGGTYSGAGQTVLNGTTTISGVSTKDLLQRTLTNNGTVNFTAAIRVYDSGVITNSATGVFTSRPMTTSPFVVRPPLERSTTPDWSRRPPARIRASST